MTPAFFLLAAVSVSPTPHEWKHLYYTMNGPEVMLWESRHAAGCILGTGPRKLVERLRAQSISGEADLLIEVLPAPKLPPAPANAIIQDYAVNVRGISVQPQCEQSKGLYWIRDFHFVRTTAPAE